MGLEAILPGILPLEFHSFVAFTAFRHLEKDVPPGAPTGPPSRTGGSQRRTSGSSWQKAGGRGPSWPTIFGQCWRPFRSKPLCCRGESMSWDSAGPEAETSSQQVECSLACLEQERHQRQGSQGQAEWRRPDQDIEDKILLLQTEVEKAQWRLDQMTHSLLAQSPARGYPNTLQVPEVPVPLRKQLEAQESHPRLHEEMAEYWRTRWHQVAVALKFKEEELQRLQRQSGTWPPQPQLVDPELGTEPYWTSGPPPGIAGLGAEEFLQDWTGHTKLGNCQLPCYSPREKSWI
ncbi:uncharacterized protein LOC106999240 isoform X2 [Macaca mulatta]